MAKTFKKMIPPELQDQSATDKDAQLTQLQSALSQMSQQHQQMVAELARATDTIRTDRLSIESKERIALMNGQIQILIQQLKDHGVAAQSQLTATLEAIGHRMETLHESMSVEQEAGAPPATPELPGQVEPKTQPVTPAAPTVPVPGTTG